MARTEEAAPPMPEQPRLLIDELQGPADEFVEEAVPVITYEPPADGDLSAVTGAMTITCHVSPDSGWKVLEPFLAATEKQICLGMYDFTAPHIYRTVRTLLKNDGVIWKQTLGPNESLPKDDDVDSTKADDLSEAKVTRGLRRVGGDRFENAFAHVGAGKTFASAYHIKVAVRDRKSFWLSSGNWQSSNQPDIDFLDPDADVPLIARFNREWHVVVDNPALAEVVAGISRARLQDGEGASRRGRRRSGDRAGSADSRRRVPARRGRGPQPRGVRAPEVRLHAGSAADRPADPDARQLHRAWFSACCASGRRSGCTSRTSR